jgi:prophage antirepressor-like protein
MSSRNTRPRPCRKWPMAAVLPLVRITCFNFLFSMYQNEA